MGMDFQLNGLDALPATASTTSKFVEDDVCILSWPVVIWKQYLWILLASKEFDSWSRDVLDGLITPPEGVSTFQNAQRQFFASGFVRPKDEPHLRFPAINLCIDNKSDMNKQDEDHDLRENYIGYFVFCFLYSINVVLTIFHRQCGLDLVANSVAYAQFANRDEPFMTLGVVTDGKVFTFLVWNLLQDCTQLIQNFAGIPTEHIRFQFK